jgi:hypothetical protein
MGKEETLSGTDCAPSSVVPQGSGAWDDPESHGAVDDPAVVAIDLDRHPTIRTPRSDSAES